MNDDLKIIKKKYGEDMMHFCRSEFSTILETPGLLPKILLENFAESRCLYQDILKEHLIEDFKKYIYFIANKKIPTKKYQYENKNENKTPKELLDEAGYILYECHSEAEIQAFKKYYAQGELICTFKGGRLNSCHVFFAIKKDVENIRIEDFKNPRRQDLYGTSVISIQIGRGEQNSVSIKNRYNHTVNNPDATFSNKLDNIIPGLERSFEKTYHFNISNKGFSKGDFIIPNYIKAYDGKNYKISTKSDDYFFGPNNIVIDKNLQVRQFDKNEFIVFESYILDLKNKKFILLEGTTKDHFLESLEPIDKISVTKNEDIRKIDIFLKDTVECDKPITMKIDKDGKIIELNHPYVREINYIKHLYNLEKLDLSNVEKLTNDCTFNFSNLKELSLSKLRKMGSANIRWLKNLQKLDLPSLEEMEDNCILNLPNLKELNLSKLRKMGSNNLKILQNLQKLDLSSLEKMEDNCILYLPNLEVLNLFKLRKMGSDNISWLQNLQKLDLPSLEEMDDLNLYALSSLEELNLSKLRKMGKLNLNNLNLQKLQLLSLEEVGTYNICYLPNLEELNLSRLKIIGSYCLYDLPSLTKLDLSNVEQMGIQCLEACPNLVKINLLSANIEVARAILTSLKQQNKNKEINYDEEANHRRD